MLVTYCDLVLSVALGHVLSNPILSQSYSIWFDPLIREIQDRVSQFQVWARFSVRDKVR